MSNHMLQHFRFEHLPEDLQVVSKKFCELAFWVEQNLDPSIEKEVCLRRLLEAKDCAVRSAVMDATSHEQDQLLEDMARTLFPHLFNKDNDPHQPQD